MTDKFWVIFLKVFQVVISIIIISIIPGLIWLISDVGIFTLRKINKWVLDFLDIPWLVIVYIFLGTSLLLWHLNRKKS